LIWSNSGIGYSRISPFLNLYVKNKYLNILRPNSGKNYSRITPPLPELAQLIFQN
jgi:hypothetical protein